MIPNAQTPDEDARLAERLRAYLHAERGPLPEPMAGWPAIHARISGQTSLDGGAMNGLMRRLEEERITAVWAHDLLAKERQESANLRACIVGLQVALRNQRERRWRERVGLVAVGVIVALCWVWVVGGGA